MAPLPSLGRGSEVGTTRILRADAPTRRIARVCGPHGGVIGEVEDDFDVASSLRMGPAANFKRSVDFRDASRQFMWLLRTVGSRAVKLG